MPKTAFADGVEVMKNPARKGVFWAIVNGAMLTKKSGQRRSFYSYNSALQAGLQKRAALNVGKQYRLSRASEI